MKISSPLCGIVLFLIPGVTVAYIPAHPLPEVGWNGPGHLCEENFTLQVDANEYVREDIQLEPWYPASNTVKSEAGWYSIVILRENPKTSQRRSRVKVFATGVLYEYLSDDANFEGRHIFVPRKRHEPLVEISFYKVDKPDPRYPDWRMAPQHSYDPLLYTTVLNRIVFSKTPQHDCINEHLTAAH